MKRVLMLVLAALTVLCLISALAEAATDAAAANPQTPARAAEPDAATLEALVAANDLEAILSRHGNMCMDRSSFIDGELVLDEYNYRDAGVYVWTNSDGSGTLNYPDLNVFRVLTDEKIYYSRTVFDSAESCETWFRESIDSGIIFLDEQETPIETIDAGDGLFTAITEIRDPETIQQLMIYGMSLGAFDYAEGMTVRFRYTFDTRTSDLLGMDAFLTDADGQACGNQTATYTYDVEEPDPEGGIKLFDEYFASLENPERTRTITVVFDPDTEDERTVELVQPVGYRFNIVNNGVGILDVFVDRACTQPYTGSDGIQDLLLYVK